MTHTSVWICSLVRSLTDRGWPHILVHGHQLARIYVRSKRPWLQKPDVLVPRQREEGRWQLSHCPGQVGDTRASPSETKGPLYSGTASTAALPHPLLWVHRVLFRWLHSLRAGNSVEGKPRSFWPDIAACHLGGSGLGWNLTLLLYFKPDTARCLLLDLCLNEGLQD